jgi:conjugative transfer signal peptidase TraF
MILWQPAPLRRRRLVIGLTMKAGLAAIALSAGLHPRPWLVYNASASVPIGFYRIDAPISLKTGDLVLANLPPDMRGLANDRRYLPASVPVLKSIAAVSGDEVCATGHRIVINGREVAERLSRDRANREMPWWEGCRRLQANDLFLLNATSVHSFDGRYTGVVSVSEVIGKARPL